MRILFLLLPSLLFCLELQRPKTYEKQDINSWLMSEKLDGIRAYWNGKELLTRKGKKIYAPKYFTKNFPSFELDGELWTKREDFENIQSIVMDKTPSLKWKTITYNIFEVPNAKGDFLKRLEKAKTWFKTKQNKYVKFIAQIKCKDSSHLSSFLEDIIKKGGEGVIIKNPNKEYFHGRSSDILKVKKAYDMEGVVIKINMNEKTKLLKSLRVKLKNNIEFNLGTGFSKKQRENGFEVGSIVTFKYFGFTQYGKPKFASFLRIRED